jgi:hypothetical protein
MGTVLMERRQRHGMVDPTTPHATRRGKRRPWLEQWMTILRTIGNAQAWLLLSIVYVVLILPMGLLFRLANDPLRLRRRPESNWQPVARQYDRLDEAGEQA